MKTYAELVEYIAGGRTKYSRPIANNTRAQLVQYAGEGTAVVIYLHWTAVVTLHADGRIVLNTGGWYTQTTKERINRFLPPEFYVAQEDDAWYLGRRRCNLFDEWIPFQDGITILGNLVGEELRCTP